MRKTIVGVLLVAASLLAVTSALAFENIKDTEFALNHGDTKSPKHQLGYQVVANKVQLLKCQYDWSKLTGAISTVNLLSIDGAKCKLPNKAIVLDGIIDVVTAPTATGSATIALGTGQGLNDLKTATGYASYTGRLDVVPVSTAATAIKLTADRFPSASIAVAALSSGKINVYIEYVTGD